MYIKTEDGNLKKAENPITVGDLFSMTAGFTYDLNSAGFQKAKELTDGKMDTVSPLKKGQCHEAKTLEAKQKNTDYDLKSYSVFFAIFAFWGSL